MTFLVPVTGALQVNSITLNQQDDARITALPGGGFVVVWESEDVSATKNNIFQQIYDAAGQPVGGNVQLNTQTTVSQSNPRIAVLEDGSWVVTWNTWNGSAPTADVMIRHVAANGTPLGTQTLVNTQTIGGQDGPEVTALQNGGFMVVWYSENGDGNGYGIRAQRYDASGTKVGSEFTVNTTVAGLQTNPHIATLENGNVLVTWQVPVLNMDGDRTGSQSHGQILTQNGTKVGAEFELLTTEAYNNVWGIDALKGGGFAAAGWSIIGGVHQVVVQVHDATGAVVSTPDYNATPGVRLYEPKVAALPDGGFVVSYTYDVAGNSNGRGHEYTFIQRYDADGEKVGSPVQVNTQVGAGVYQKDADLTVLEDGRIVVSWEGYNQNGDDGEVFIRTFESQMVGTQSRDKLAGTKADDIISGRGGNDLLNGRGGDDLIRGGDGNDILRGSGGKDRLEGGDGSDHLQGGNARDFLIGGRGRDVLNGGNGNDVLNGGAGADQFIFSAGRDKITKFEDNRDELVLHRGALGLNGKDAQDVLDDYGSIVGGNAVFDFGGGDILTVRGVTDLSVLADDISFL